MSMNVVPRVCVCTMCMQCPWKPEVELQIIISYYVGAGPLQEQ